MEDSAIKCKRKFSVNHLLRRNRESRAEQAVSAGKTTQELLQIGYPTVLAAISIAGMLPIVLARFKVPRLSAIFPAAAIEGLFTPQHQTLIAKLDDELRADLASLLTLCLPKSITLHPSKKSG